MKTIKITLITAMMALGAIIFGQVQKVQYISADYSEKSSRFENLVRNVLSRTEKPEREAYREPVVEQYDAEAWMALPFECSVAESDLVLEDWMSSPFESRYADVDLAIESWMTRPFESTFADAELIIEDWMTRPFGADDHIEVESWMTAVF